MSIVEGFFICATPLAKKEKYAGAEKCDKPGTESYSFTETMKSPKIYYRLRMFDKNKVVTFSKTVTSGGGLKITNNPTIDKLSLNFSSTNNQTVQIRVYDLIGRIQINQKDKCLPGQ